MRSGCMRRDQGGLRADFIHQVAFRCRAGPLHNGRQMLPSPYACLRFNFHPGPLNIHDRRTSCGGDHSIKALRAEAGCCWPWARSDYHRPAVDGKHEGEGGMISSTRRHMARIMSCSGCDGVDVKDSSQPVLGYTLFAFHDWQCSLYCRS